MVSSEIIYPKSYYLLVGGYRSTDKGIEVFKFYDDGRLELVSQSKDISNPSYLCLNKEKKCLYAVSEVENDAKVHTYRFDHSTGSLHLLNKEPVLGKAPCYISLARQGNHLFIANYGSGSLSVHPVGEDGMVQPIVQHVQDFGNSVDKERQESPHVHAALATPDQKFLIVTDLGTDTVRILAYQPEHTRPLSLARDVQIKPGSGPRHIAFSRDGDVVYLLTELTAEIIVFAYSEGIATYVQTIGLTQKDSEVEPGGGDILLSANGSFLYATNRGDVNEIVVFAVDTVSGMLTALQRCHSEGKSPRNLAFSPTGEYLLIANEEGSNVVVFELNVNTGLIGGIVANIPVEKPSFLHFITP